MKPLEKQLSMRLDGSRSRPTSSTTPPTSSSAFRTPPYNLFLVILLVLTLVAAGVTVGVILSNRDDNQSPVTTLRDTDVPATDVPATHVPTTPLPTTLSPSNGVPSLAPTFTTPPTAVPTVCEEKTLYSIEYGTGDFYEIDKTTGALTLRGNTGYPWLRAGATDSTGRLLAMGLGTNLYQIDPSRNGTASPFVAIQTPNGVVWDVLAMATDSSDTLYVVNLENEDDDSRKIYQIDYLGSGEVTFVTTVFADLWGCGFDFSDNLYCTESGQYREDKVDKLYRVDLSSGAPFFIANLGTNAADEAVEYDPCGNVLWMISWFGLYSYDLRTKDVVQVGPFIGMFMTLLFLA